MAYAKTKVRIFNRKGMPRINPIFILLGVSKLSCGFHFIKEELNFLNTEFIIKKNSGRNTFGTERYFRFIEELGNNILLPKGFIGKLIRFCRENSMAYNFIDQRKLNSPVTYSFCVYGSQIYVKERNNNLFYIIDII